MAEAEFDDFEGVKENLQCPVCDHYMCAPIRQCRTGHSICSQCFAKIKNCPKCRGPKSDARCYALEAIASRLILSCRFKIDGCTFTSKGGAIANHEKFCHYSPIYCPFRTYDNCTWVGVLDKLQCHCHRKHRNNFYSKSKQKFLSKNFKEILGYHYIYVVIHAYHEYFRLTWELDSATGFTKWAIYFMGSKEDAKKFSYKIEFPKEPHGEYEDVLRSILWKSPCDILPTDDSIKFASNNYLMIHRDLLCQYCERNGDLNYISTIYRSNHCKNTEPEEVDNENSTSKEFGCPDEENELNSEAEIL